MIFKTVYQYSSAPIPQKDMARLQEIAEDCCKVRNYVYGRYGGIGGLAKLYPGYTVQNEMTKSGLRESLGLPSVYFYLAIYDALGDIKSQWARTKAKVEKNIQAHIGLTLEDKHYLRFVMRQSQCFEMILTGMHIDLTQEWESIYQSVSADVDVHKLNRYLCRQIRRYLVRPHTDAANGFTVSPKGYRYADHGIYLSMKERRNRLFIPLTDNNCYSRQIYIRLCKEEGKVIIKVPVQIRQRHPEGYDNVMGVAVGMQPMFVTDRGNIYGKDYFEYQSALTEYIQERLAGHRRYAKNNPGRKKYNAGKVRREKALHAYVNAEINRMLETEKPKVLYYPRLPDTSKAGKNRKVNASVNMWQRGFVKKRLIQKCQERSINFVEVFGKGISVNCYICGTEGVKEGGMFRCISCGLEMAEKQNTAKNVLRKGMETEGKDHYGESHR